MPGLITFEILMRVNSNFAPISKNPMFLVLSITAFSRGNDVTNLALKLYFNIMVYLYDSL